MKFSFSLQFSYFLEAISFGWILSRLVKGVDIRKTGSGRTGTTNTMRASGYPIAILTLLLDGFKGVASDWLARYLASGRIGLEIIAPIFAIIIHNDSFFLVEKNTTDKLIFKGRAGRATALGGTVALMPSAFPMISAIALIMFFAVGYVSSGSNSLLFLCVCATRKHIRTTKITSLFEWLVYISNCWYGSLATLSVGASTLLLSIYSIFARFIFPAVYCVWDFEHGLIGSGFAAEYNPVKKMVPNAA